MYVSLSPKAREVAANLVARFEAGEVNPPYASMLITPRDDLPAAKWTVSNCLMAYLTTSTATQASFDWRGYDQWKEVGRQVRAHQSAGFILGPSKKKQKDVRGWDGKGDPDEQVLVGYHSIPIFAYHQTDPIEGAEVVYQPVDYQAPVLPPLADVAAALGVVVQYKPGNGYYGTVQPDGSKITLHTYDQKVFFHELAHAVHAKMDGALKPGQDSHQETVAEFTACVLAQMYGQDTSGRSWEYIKGYNSDPILAIQQAMKTVEKIIGVLDKTYQHINSASISLPSPN